MGAGQSRAVNRESTEEPEGRIHSRAVTREPTEEADEASQSQIVTREPIEELEGISQPPRHSPPRAAGLGISFNPRASTIRQQDDDDDDDLPDYEEDSNAPTKQDLAMEQRLKQLEDQVLGYNEVYQWHRKMTELAEEDRVWAERRLAFSMREVESLQRFIKERGEFHLGSPRGLPVNSPVYHGQFSRGQWSESPPTPSRQQRPRSNPERQPTRYPKNRRRAQSSDRGTPVLDPTSRRFDPGTPQSQESVPQSSPSSSPPKTPRRGDRRSPSVSGPPTVPRTGGKRKGSEEVFPDNKKPRTSEERSAPAPVPRKRGRRTAADMFDLEDEKEAEAKAAALERAREAEAQAAALEEAREAEAQAVALERAREEAQVAALERAREEAQAAARARQTPLTVPRSDRVTRSTAARRGIEVPDVWEGTPVKKEPRGSKGRRAKGRR